MRLRPAYKDHVWAYDFVSDRTHDGVSFKMLTVVDEFTRECLAIDVARKLTSDDVLERLSRLMATREVPEPIRSDKGPEFTAKCVRRWLADVQVRTLFIAPGSPWENGYVESFNGKRRSELLDREIFYSLREAKVLIEWWRQHYHQVQPHSALGWPWATGRRHRKRRPWAGPMLRSGPAHGDSGVEANPPPHEIPQAAHAAHG